MVKIGNSANCETIQSSSTEIKCEVSGNGDGILESMRDHKIYVSVSNYGNSLLSLNDFSDSMFTLFPVVESIENNSGSWVGGGSLVFKGSGFPRFTYIY